jgi:thiamine pyrophosphate-dependent acetolactate synthase large subunit-like protein
MPFLQKPARILRTGQYGFLRGNPDFSRYADNCGALGIRITEKSVLPAAFKRLLAHDGPAMLEIVTDAALI